MPNNSPQISGVDTDVDDDAIHYVKPSFEGWPQTREELKQLFRYHAPHLSEEELEHIADDCTLSTRPAS